MLAGGTPEQEADLRLLEFGEYEDYLDSLITDQDLHYLRSVQLARKVAELGYRSSGETLTKEKFLRRKMKAHELVAPIRIFAPSIAVGLKLCRDPLAEQLAFRERLNRARIVSTIVFVRILTKKKAELSAFIDFLHRLETTDLTGFFAGQKRLYPRSTDLGFYNAKSKICFTNSTPNFESCIDPEKGIMLQSKYDHMMIDLDPNSPPGRSTISMTVQSPNYDQCIIIDHVIRKRIG